MILKTEKLIIFFSSEAGNAEFSDLSIAQPGYYHIIAICGKYELTGPEFAIHDWPELATIKKQTIGLRYTGSLYYAVETINALNKVISEDNEEVSVTDIETDLPHTCTKWIKSLKQSYNTIIRILDHIFFIEGSEIL